MKYYYASKNKKKKHFYQQHHHFHRQTTLTIVSHYSFLAMYHDSYRFVTKLDRHQTLDFYNTYTKQNKTKCGLEQFNKNRETQTCLIFLQCKHRLLIRLLYNMHCHDVLSIVRRDIFHSTHQNKKKKSRIKVDNYVQQPHSTRNQSSYTSISASFT
jgi:hypothetical protein